MEAAPRKRLMERIAAFASCGGAASAAAAAAGAGVGMEVLAIS